MEDKRERIDIIETLDPAEISYTQLKKLTEELAETRNGELRHALAIKLLEVAELGEQEINLHPLIATITALVDKKHISTHLWFCSHFDCSEYIELFTRVVIQNETEAYVEALSVFENMQGPIAANTKQSVIDSLTQYVAGLEADHYKKPVIPELIALITELPTDEKSM